MVNLLPACSDRSRDHPQGPPTYIRHASTNPGALQISWVSYSRPGPPPQMTDDGLIKFASRPAAGRGARVVSQCVGNSGWGRFGCVVAVTPQNRMQVWVINNGPNIVFATHTGPNRSEITEVERVAMGIAESKKGP